MLKGDRYLRKPDPNRPAAPERSRVAPRPFDWRMRFADVALNASVPWRIAFGGGGLSGLQADLGGLRIEAFGVAGAASDVELTLPELPGAVFVRFDGGVRNVAIRRPEGVRVGAGGANNVRVSPEGG